MECDKFANFLLLNGITDGNVQLLQEQEIDETAARMLTEMDLLKIGVKLGQIKRFLHLMKLLKADKKPHSQKLLINPDEQSASVSDGRYDENRDLKKVLIRHSRKGKDLAEKLSNNNDLTSIDLKSLNRIFVDDLVFVCGYYPTPEDKLACAMAIVRNFPQLAQNENPDIPPYGAWFHISRARNNQKQNIGKIEYRLENERVKLDPRLKKMGSIPKQIRRLHPKCHTNSQKSNATTTSNITIPAKNPTTNESDCSRNNFMQSNRTTKEPVRNFPISDRPGTSVSNNFSDVDCETSDHVNSTIHSIYERKKKPKKSKSCTKYLVKKVEQILKCGDSPEDIVGINVANKLKLLPGNTKIHTERIINELLCYAQLGYIHKETKITGLKDLIDLSAVFI